MSRVQKTAPAPALALMLAVLLTPLTASAATLAPASGPNPVILGGHYELDATKHSVKLDSDCRSYPSKQPLGTLEVTGVIPEVKMKTTAYLLAVVAPSGEVTCVVDMYHQGGAELLFRGFKPGTYKIFVGDQYNKPAATPRTASLKVLNTKRGYVYAWEGKVKPTKLDAAPAQAIQVDGAVKAGGAWSAIDHAQNQCVGLKIPDVPAAILDVVRDIALENTIGSAKDLYVARLGPLPEGGGTIPSDCFPVGGGVNQSLKPGRYLLYPAMKKPADATYAIAAFDPKTTKRAPTKMVASPGIGTDLDHRGALRLFPQLSVKADLLLDDANRAAVLEAVPAGMFVYPTTDLTQADGAPALQAIGGRIAAIEDASHKTELPPTALPKKDEPLLSLGDGFFLATDGGLFQIKAQHLLALKPAGKPALPAKARPMWATLQQSEHLAAPADAKVIKDVKHRAEVQRKCDDRVWRGPNAKIAAYGRRADGIRASHRFLSRADHRRLEAIGRSVGRLQAKTLKKARRVCKHEQNTQKDEHARAQLIQSRAARRQTLLEKLQARF